MDDRSVNEQIAATTVEVCSLVSLHSPQSQPEYVHILSSTLAECDNIFRGAIEGLQDAKCASQATRAWESTRFRYLVFLQQNLETLHRLAQNSAFTSDSSVSPTVIRTQTMDAVPEPPGCEACKAFQENVDEINAQLEKLKLEIVEDLRKAKSYQSALKVLNELLETRTREKSRKGNMQTTSQGVELAILRIEQTIAVTLKDQGKFEEAEEKILDVWERRKQILDQTMPSDGYQVLHWHPYEADENFRQAQLLLCEILRQRQQDEKAWNAQYLYHEAWSRYDAKLHGDLSRDINGGWRLENGYHYTNTLRERGLTPKAMDELREVVAACPRQSPWRITSAETLIAWLIEQKNWREAFDLMKIHFVMDEEDTGEAMAPQRLYDSAESLAQWQLSNDKFGEAKWTCQRIRQYFKPETKSDIGYRATFMLSVSQYELGEHEAAVRLLQDLETLGKDDIPVNELLAWTFLRLNDQTEAEKYAKKVWQSATANSSARNPRYCSGVALIWLAFSDVGALSERSAAKDHIWPKVREQVEQKAANLSQVDREAIWNLWKKLEDKLRDYSKNHRKSDLALSLAQAVERARTSIFRQPN